MRHTLVAIALAVACGTPPRERPIVPVAEPAPPPAVTPPPPAPPPARVIAGRSKVATRYGIVATSQPLAARAGAQVLERGGNAVDAAIATNAVMSVVEPHN